MTKRTLGEKPMTKRKKRKFYKTVRSRGHLLAVKRLLALHLNLPAARPLHYHVISIDKDGNDVED